MDGQESAGYRQRTSATNLDEVSILDMHVDSLPRRSAESPTPPRGRLRSRVLAELDGASPFAFVGPNWFATVMGTGILTLAAAGLPVAFPGRIAFAQTVWILSAGALIALCVATACHWVLYPRVARSHLAHPTLAHFYGAPAMAALTVGAGAHLVAGPLIGTAAANLIALVLWCAGTFFGWWTAVAVPARMFGGQSTPPDAAAGFWLMPVVPPMVSAATGPALIPLLPQGQWQLTMLVACWAMFGTSLLAAVMITTLVWSRLAHHRIGPAAMVPTLWIVLGPIGQSMTAADHLGSASGNVLPEPFGTAMRTFGAVVGLPMLGFGVLWLLIALTLTIRTARTGLPFTLTWWSFTFPVGAMVTGVSAVAVLTGATVLRGLAVVLFVALIAVWTVVGARTLAGVVSGKLLLAPNVIR